MTSGILHDQNLEKQIEKQMGCMTGFFHIFDRNQVLNGKRIYTSKRLAPYSPVDYSSQSECSVGSPAYSGELRPNQSQKKKEKDLKDTRRSPSPAPTPVPEPDTPARMSAPSTLPVFEFKEGTRSYSWKFKEAPRLSLDSRATVDAKGSLYPKEIRTTPYNAKEDDNDKQKRSPSVIARLMGLEALPDSGREPMKKVELRRSASESRVSRELRFVDGNNFQVKNLNQTNPHPNVNRETNVVQDYINQFEANKARSVSSRQQLQQPKSFFDTQDFFPEPKQNGSLYGEIEKRLKLRGIDEPAKDLETLKHILEALQLKGLLHSKKQEQEDDEIRNFVLDRRYSGEEVSPIVVVKPSARAQVSVNRIGSNPKPRTVEILRNLNFSGECLTPVRRDVRNSKFGKQDQSSEKSPKSIGRRRVESKNLSCQRKGNDPVGQRRSSPVHSPKINTRKVASDQTTVKSPRSKSVAEIDLDRSKMDDYKQGRSLLERCDKLLHSIAEITAPAPAPAAATELQPSPVSVLDSSFYKDESSPSPVMKRCISFPGGKPEKPASLGISMAPLAQLVSCKDCRDQPVELDDENWSPVISPVRLKSTDSDFHYVSEILRASNCLSEDADVFWLLEKQQYRTTSSDSSRQHRKLVFDVITEILHRKTQLPPWKTFSSTKSITGASHLQQIWSEFQKIREKDEAEDLFEIIGGVLKKDMQGDTSNGWGDTPVETSEAVLDIERLIFKDLVVEAIQDLATFSGRYRAPLLRRKLVF